jgi:hypothetical protein
MADAPAFDMDVVNEYFSVECFNRAWDLLDKPTRTPEQNQQMIQLSIASLWHWTQRGDCTDTNLSIGYWQTSRVYAVAGLAEEAHRYGELCLEVSQKPGVPPFYLGYAHEALARAARVAGDSKVAQQHLAEARRIADAVPDPEGRAQLLTDLDALR